jgi:hypothetical protein
MTMPVPAQALACRVCGCVADHAAHAIAAALADDDVDAAIELRLLDAAPCDACAPGCRTALMHARDSRLRAFAARQRFRARNARLQRRAEARAAARVPARVPENAQPEMPTLPPAAAAALARAKAKAASRDPR